MLGITLGVIKGHTRSLDHGSYYGYAGLLASTVKVCRYNACRIPVRRSVVCAVDCFPSFGCRGLPAK